MKITKLIAMALLLILLTGCGKSIKNEAGSADKTKTQSQKNEKINTSKTFENDYFTFEYLENQKVENVESAKELSFIRVSGEKTNKSALPDYVIGISVERFSDHINKLTFDESIKTTIINSENNSSALNLYRNQIDKGNTSHFEQTKIKNNDALVSFFDNFSIGRIYILKDQYLYQIRLSDGYRESINELNTKGYNNNLLLLLKDKPYYNIIESLDIK